MIALLLNFELFQLDIKYYFCSYFHLIIKILIFEDFSHIFIAECYIAPRLVYLFKLLSIILIIEVMISYFTWLTSE